MVVLHENHRDHWRNELSTNQDAATIDAIIFDELYHGQFTDTGRSTYVRIIQRLAD